MTATNADGSVFCSMHICVHSKHVRGIYERVMVVI